MKKLIKLSLAAAMMTSLGFATDIESDFGGDVKFYYGTSSHGAGSLFDKGPSEAKIGSSQANIGLSLEALFSSGENTNAGIKAVFLDTAGLEGSLINKTNGSLETTGGDTLAITEAFIARRFGNTGIIVGRQVMQTPMMFGETSQTLYENTFNAFTAVNKDFSGYTFIGSVVGGSNDSKDLSTFDTENIGGNSYILGALMTPMDGVLANAWYYKTEGESQIMWADASMDTYYDTTLFAQAARTTMVGDEKTTMYGIKAETEYEGVRITGAYNYVDREAGSIDMKNRATASEVTGSRSTTSLFTQMYANQDFIAGTEGESVNSMMISAEKEMGQVNYKVAYGTNFDESEYNFIAEGEYSDIDMIGVVGISDDIQGASAFLTVTAAYKF